MGNLQPAFRGFQPPDVRRENPQTAGVSLLAVETQQLHADAAVSYTHLDVYKRQVAAL